MTSTPATHMVILVKVGRGCSYNVHNVVRFVYHGSSLSMKLKKF